MSSVLVVEDDHNIRAALIHSLTEGGHAVRSASTALAALREVADDPPDAVILDLGLPDLDGIDALKMLRGLLAAVLRRGPFRRRVEPVTVGELSVDVERREATLAGSPLELTRKEFDLLAYLAQRAGRVVSRRELLTEVWQQPYGGDDQTIDVHLSWLRRKLGESALQARYLHTVRGVGVKLVEPE
jgi:DNA-binding response OmpR family regulator